MGDIFPIIREPRPQSDFVSLGSVVKKFRPKRPAVVICEECGEPTWDDTEGTYKDCKCRRIALEDYEKRREEEKKQEIIFERKRKIDELYSMTGMGQRLKDMTFDSFTVERATRPFHICKKYAETFPERIKDGRGIILSGTVGTGKTHLAVSIANFVINNYQYSIVYRTSIQLLNSIRQNFGQNDPTPILISADLLILDDLGKENKTGWVGEKLFEIINARYEDYKPIVITTNLDMTSLSSHIGDACFSRLREVCRGTFLDMVGSDYRKM